MRSYFLGAFAVLVLVLLVPTEASMKPRAVTSKVVKPQLDASRNAFLKPSDACNCDTCNCNGNFCPDEISAGQDSATVSYGLSGELVVKEIRAVPTDGSLIIVRSMDDANYNLFIQGQQYNFFPGFSSEIPSVTCYRAAPGIVYSTGFHTVILCDTPPTGFDSCSVEYFVSVDTYVPPPPHHNHSGQQCRCNCCWGDNCTTKLAGSIPIADCNICSSGSCIAAFPSQCPTAAMSGQVEAVCKSGGSFIAPSFLALAVFLAMSLF